MHKLKYFQPTSTPFKQICGLPPKSSLREATALYITLPPRYRHVDLHKKVHEIHNETLFYGLQYMTVFMKEQNISAKRAVMQFRSQRLRRLFWEYYFMGKDVLREALSQECMRHKSSEVWQRNFHGMNVVDEALAQSEAEHDAADIEASRQNTFIEDLEFFEELYAQHGWEPSYMVKADEQLHDLVKWDGVPIRVSTGSIASYPSGWFNLSIDNLPHGAQEWHLDEWYKDNVIQNTTQFPSIVPQLKRRAVHLREGGIETHRASMRVHLGKYHGLPEGNELLQQVVEALREAPFMGQQLDVQDVNSETKL